MHLLGNRFKVEFPDDSDRELHLGDGNLHQIFALIEHEGIEGPIELFEGLTRVAVLRRWPEGLWELGR